MREKIVNIGLIIALIVAGVSLPTAIISFSREPTVNNYYTDNFYYNQTYYNQTWYGDFPDPEPFYPPETNTFVDLMGNPDWFYDSVYNLTGDYIIYWYINCSDQTSNSFSVYICQDYMFDLWNEDRDAHYYLISRGIYISQGFASQSWTVNSSDTWHICWRYDHSVTVTNVTIRTIINKI